ncbi:hypothetical protein AA13595_0848 [Gluconacetobacter johannae DSM 13595]|nr:hypothetical protein AA13595_0848 [Gluconacetobacter johannae DSM 13595]
MRGVDISIILNVHKEQDLFYPAIRSIEETVDHARLFNIECELVIVLDAPDERTASIVRDYDFSTFGRVVVETVALRSLGLSRNRGIDLARGHYIATADADDLLSYNYLHTMYMALHASPEKAAVFPEYYQAFGGQNYVCRLYPLKKTGVRRLAGSHTYVSRLMARRADLKRIRYRDCSSHRLYAYEDYDLNLRLVADGFDLLIARDVVVFYRQHDRSIMASLGAPDRYIANNSDFFAPDIFARLIEKEDSAQVISQMHLDFGDDCRESSYIQNLISQANKIEPEVQPRSLREATFFTNVGQSEAFGKAFWNIFRHLKGTDYTDVFFMPFLSKGGGEKYIMHFVQTAMRDYGRSCLILLGEHLDAGKPRLDVPDGIDIIDLHALLGTEQADKIPELALRVVENVAPNANLFMKACPFSNAFMQKFSYGLTRHAIMYFYFCSSYYMFNGTLYEDGWDYRFLSDHSNVVTCVISDHEANLKELDCRIPSYKDRTFLLYTHSGITRPSSNYGAGKKRLVWASRLDLQKRPSLLCAIATELAALGETVEIHVYGDSILNHFDPACFDGHPNLAYRGSFNGLDSIPFEENDAFLYTSLFDGLPNVLLEAADMRIPIISVDVGGVSELIDDDSAFVVRKTTDDRELVLRYIEKIRCFLASTSAEILKKTGRLHDRMKAQHGVERYRQNVGAFYAMLAGNAQEGDLTT